MPEARTIYHYHYNAHGHALSGEILRPFRETIEVQAGMSLPTTGGYGCARVENFRLKCAVSFKSAFTQVMGSFDSETKQHTTLVSTTIEGLNFLDVVTADRIVMRLASHFHLDNDADPPKLDKEPHITVLGSHFVNLRIAGCSTRVEFDHELFLRIDTFEALLEELKSNAGFRKMALNPYHTGPDQELPGPCGIVLCSIAKDIHVECPGVTRKGHVLTVPEFGKIHVAELIAEHSRRTLTMLRFELGSPGAGGGTACSGQSNGKTIPPSP